MAPESSAQLASYFAAGGGVGVLAMGTVFGALTPRQGPGCPLSNRAPQESLYPVHF